MFLKVFAVFYAFSLVVAELPFRKFEYKQSFKGPHLVQRDGSVPFWEYGGDAIASDDSIRITPSLKSKKGHVWSKSPTWYEHWEVEVVFRVTGRGRVGADGVAIWFTKEKGAQGPVFGSTDNWNGLAVIMDSFDNDAQHNNPYIMAIVNDGTKSYDHATDGQNQHLGGCMRDFRNKPYPVRIKIEYYNKGLSIHFNNGMTGKKEDYDLCMRAENVELPKEGHFGISAATGGLADDHDVLSFLTHSLATQDVKQPVETQKFTDEEKVKYDKEFDEYYEKLQKARDEYQKDHPKTPGIDPNEDYEGEKWFETQDARELKQIFDGQAAIDATLRQFGSKVDEIIGRQERMFSQLTIIGQKTGQSGQPDQGGQAPAIPIDTIKREEVNLLLNANNELARTLRDVKMRVNEIAERRPDTDATGAYQFESMTSEVRQTMSRLQEEIRHLSAKQGDQVQCPDTPCLTTTYFFLFMVIHALVFIGYLVYRSNKEAQAKKFY